MENLKYSILLECSVLFVFGFICFLVSGSIKIKGSENATRNKVTDLIFGTGELAIFFSTLGILRYIFQEFAGTSILLNYLLFPFVSMILTVLLSGTIGMWVRWKRPGTEFPPSKDKQ